MELLSQLLKWLLNFKLFPFIVDKEGLGIKIPNSATFGINDIRSAVGSRRLLDVMNVNTQTNSTMTMKEWHKYYETPPEQRRDLYNVISLEFSNTKLDNQVKYLKSSILDDVLKTEKPSTLTISSLKCPNTKTQKKKSVRRPWNLP